MKKSIIYTCTGDTGMTSLVGGMRVKKNCVRIEAYGTVDELSSVLGVLSSHEYKMSQDEIIKFVQNKLFNIGAYLATEISDGETQPAWGLNNEDVIRLEHMIDEIDNQLPQLKNFVLPGGALMSSMAQMARTVCRRCERRIIDLAEVAYVDPLVIKFINRLSDYLFVLARFINVSEGINEKIWDKDC
jgi:cob(I)alamin adenosyltransferase